MGKENISATVDPDVARYVERDSVNTSGLVNRLLKNYLNGDSGEVQMLRLREEQLKSELEAAREKVNTTEKQLNSVQERINQLKADRQNSLDQAIEALDRVEDDLTKDHQAVEYQAQQANVAPKTLWEEYLNSL